MDSKFSAGLSGALDSGAFTDLNRLNQLKVGQDRDSEGNIRKVAQEFESLFLNEMMKAMRSANDVFAEGNFMNSNESKTYRDMYDQQLSVTLAQGRGMGLADVLTRQLSKMNKGSARPSPFGPAAVEVPLQASSPPGGPQSIESRDDSKLLNQRRLSLPSKLSSPLIAGLTVPAGQNEGVPLAGKDWVSAQAFAAPATNALSIGAEDETAGVAGSIASTKKTFSSPADFIATLLPMAEAAANKIGVDARYLVAQAALETGWGKSIIRQQDGSSSHNLFGIKAHRGWDGEGARVQTTEYKGGKAVKEAATFRAYESFQESFQDYVSFLQGNGRYKEALQVTDNPERFVRELQQAGYATDPQYARKVAQIARQMQTYQTVAAVDVVPAKVRG